MKNLDLFIRFLLDKREYLSSDRFIIMGMDFGRTGLTRDECRDLLVYLDDQNLIKASPQRSFYRVEAEKVKEIKENGLELGGSWFVRYRDDKSYLLKYSGYLKNFDRILIEIDEESSRKLKGTLNSDSHAKGLDKLSFDGRGQKINKYRFSLMQFALIRFLYQSNNFIESAELKGKIRVFFLKHKPFSRKGSVALTALVRASNQKLRYYDIPFRVTNKRPYGYRLESLS